MARQRPRWGGSTNVDAAGPATRHSGLRGEALRTKIGCRVVTHYGAHRGARPRFLLLACLDADMAAKAAKA